MTLGVATDGSWGSAVSYERGTPVPSLSLVGTLVHKDTRRP